MNLCCLQYFVYSSAVALRLIRFEFVLFIFLFIYSLVVALRLIRLVRITRILWERRHLQTGARQFISQNKRRYQQNGFDLDLTYVTPRVIAMSYPSTGRMSLYRNDIKVRTLYLLYRLSITS